MKTEDIQKIYSDYVLPTYSHLPVCLVKGKGSRVWDLENREYLDFFPGWAVSGLGHCHPRVTNALKQQSRKMIHISNNFYNVKQGLLAKEISDYSFPSKVFFCNSGAESIEAAIKYSRLYGSKEGRFEIITFGKSFHGRTLGAMTATAQEKIQKGFEPLPQKFLYAEFNDLESVKKLITERTVAILLEPIQGEGGVRVASKEFIQGLREICDERDMLLVFDEVQTGMGRTGKMFAFQHFGVNPDLMTLAKSLGGGAPIGALVVNNEIKRQVFQAGTHASTFGGNPLVTAASLAVFKAIEKDKLLNHTVEMGDLLQKGLEELKSKFSAVEEVRGIGLMRALKLSCETAPYAEKAMAKGLLINATQGDVLRVMPAMTVSPKELKKGLQILEEVFQELSA